MSSGTSIIEDALGEIGGNSVLAPADPATIIKGFDKLNDMMQQWLSDEIELGIVPLKTPGIDLNEPPGTRNAIVQNLALELAPTLSSGKAIVSPQLRLNAFLNLERVRQQYQTIDIPLKVVSQTLPKGAGNNKGIFRKTFFGRGGTIEN